MHISYKTIHDIDKTQLQGLFLALEWSSGHYPEKLCAAMKNYETVYTAWNGDTLVGLLCAMDDGVMTAYIHYFLVHPNYQRHGIGRRLIEMAKQHYQAYLRIVLIAYDTADPFFDACGFEKGRDESPMFITSLWT